jgi:hypothetical protein
MALRSRRACGQSSHPVPASSAAPVQSALLQCSGIPSSSSSSFLRLALSGRRGLRPARQIRMGPLAPPSPSWHALSPSPCPRPPLFSVAPRKWAIRVMVRVSPSQLEAVEAALRPKFARLAKAPVNSFGPLGCEGTNKSCIDTQKRSSIKS